MKQGILNGVARLVTTALGLFGRRKQAIAQAILSDAFLPVWRQPVAGGVILFYGQGLKPVLRGQTLLTKEPETIAWLDGMSEADRLWDVGGNIGVYSLYAAHQRGVRVYAFEPEASNFAVLCRNIAINKLDDRITAFCIALTEQAGVDVLNVAHLVAGASSTQFGHTVDQLGRPFTPAMRQGCFGFPIDELISVHGFEPPTHIKIDVDGLEPAILAGAERTLADPTLKSILVEAVEEQADGRRQIEDVLARHGFRRDSYSRGNHIFVRGGDAATKGAQKESSD